MAITMLRMAPLHVCYDLLPSTLYATDVSTACAMSAGLAAYFMGLGKTGSEARTELINRAYPRLKSRNAKKVIWNGYDSSKTETAVPPPPEIPAPSCNPASQGGYDRELAIDALEDFCTFQTGEISAGSEPISKTYESGLRPGTLIRLTAAWDEPDSSQNCPPSQSPHQNEGRDCNTIFHSIVDCEFPYLSHVSSHHILISLGPAWDWQRSGGSISWNCGYWSLVFDQGSHDLPPT